MDSVAPGRAVRTVLAAVQHPTAVDRRECCEGGFCVAFAALHLAVR